MTNLPVSLFGMDRWQFLFTGLPWLWADAYFFKTICFLLTYILFFRTMSSVRSHAAGGENLFMMILQFLETFVGSMSSGCTFASHSVAHGSKVYKILFSTIVCIWNMALHVLQDLVLGNFHFYHFLESKALSFAEPINRQNGLGAILFQLNLLQHLPVWLFLHLQSYNKHW